MKVFVTGATGILGSEISRKFLDEGHEVLGFDSKSIALDNLNDVKQKMLDFDPDLVIHAAAITNVDLCEIDKPIAININLNGTKNIAIMAAEAKAKIIFISSCGVYGNGKSTPYFEDDLLKPTTFHHETKQKGEELIRAYHSNALIVRPGWLFGGTTEHKKNFVEARRKEAIQSSVLQSANDKIGSPTSTLQLASQIYTLAQNDYSGTFNIANIGSTSRFEYVQQIVRLLELQCTVKPISSTAFPRAANVPDNEALDIRKLKETGLNSMADWKDALKEYIYLTYRKI